MTPEQFTYWLQGFVEISNSKSLTETEWKIIKDHLATVFNKITPNRITSPGPSVSPGTIWPNDPMKPDVYPNPNSPWTTPNYPKPEIIC